MPSILYIKALRIECWANPQTFLVQTITRRSIAAVASPFLSWYKKVPKKNKTEKSFNAAGHTPGPLFCRAFTHFRFKDLIIIFPGIVALFQQISFGWNQAKQWWPFAQEGHSKFLHKGLKAKGYPGKKIAAQVLHDLPGKGQVRQRSLSAESLFGYFCGDKSN